MKGNVTFFSLLAELKGKKKILMSICLFEPPHDKTNKMACAHQPSLIRDLAVRLESLGS